MSTSSVFSIGEVNGPEACRLMTDIGPVNGPSEWKAGAAFVGLEVAGFERLCLLCMASNSMLLAYEQLRWRMC